MGVRGFMSDGAVLIWRPDLADYRLAAGHPLDPVRLQLSVSLMRDYDSLPACATLSPKSATDEDLLRVHSAEYVAAVREASGRPSAFVGKMGLGSADNPVFERMHEVSSLICGGSILAIQTALSAEGPRRAFAIAGGLHHAHKARAAGFCVYNDPAVAIARARADQPGLRVMYLDIDAHHGDGVQEAFYDCDEVLTVSLHETGRFLFPGTGEVTEVGEGAGQGCAANVPLPPYATDECYRLAFDRLVVPLARSFRPEVIVAQLGADALHDDPLTQLALTLPGYRMLTERILDLAEELCFGRLAALGGGGYDVYSGVPRAWAWLWGRLSEQSLPEALPEAFRERIRGFLSAEPPTTLGADDRAELPSQRARDVYEESREVIEAARRALAPWHGRLNAE
jgi:acetoin utilization protein AcuC